MMRRPWNGKWSCALQTLRGIKHLVSLTAVSDLAKSITAEDRLQVRRRGRLASGLKNGRYVDNGGSSSADRLTFDKTTREEIWRTLPSEAHLGVA